MPSNKFICTNCTVRIPSNRPKLCCTVCNEYKHPKCQKLTVSDAKLIIATDASWICNDCRFDILPINAVKAPTNTLPKFKIKCACCNGYSYSARNTATCTWCKNIVHSKCHKQELGCLTCAESMIPGYHATWYELTGSDYNDQLNNHINNP